MTDAAGAARVAAKVRQAIRHRRLPHGASRASAFVTVSIGVVTGFPSAGVASPHASPSNSPTGPPPRRTRWPLRGGWLGIPRTLALSLRLPAREAA